MDGPFLKGEWYKDIQGLINHMGSSQSFTNNLEWRRAVKHFAEGPVQTELVIKAMVNAPSSFGLQPYKILAVQNKELKEQLRPACYDQAQVTECHTLFVLCAVNNVEDRAEEYLKLTGAEGMRDMLMGFLSHLPDKTAWAARQAYIALGFGLAACAELQIASCPMEGFVPSQVTQILDLSSNLTPVVLLAVGQHSGQEEAFPRFRFPESELLRVYA
jgi:nitroreductase/dihydropteridine reductase